MLYRGHSVPELPTDYRFLLNTLPESELLKCMVFLHANIRARPCHVKDFKQPLL